jgi:hypothetical protein
MLCPAIDNPASCEIHDVVLFLHAKNMSAEEIIVNYARFMAKV